jgi:hypothetical protein
MAPQKRGMMGWSWWPLRRSIFAIIISFVIFIALDLLFVHKGSLSTFIAIFIAAPYAVLFIIGFPSNPSYHHLLPQKKDPELPPEEPIQKRSEL